MNIPETQFEIWAKPGASTTATKTYNSIQIALAEGPYPEAYKPNIYLQGSYRNSTNIWSESDVDIVVENRCALFSDLSALSASQKAAYDAAFKKATYTWTDCYDHTLAALRNYYGADDVVAGTKAISVKTPYRMADVVVAVQHRKYSQFISIGDQKYVEGIAIRLKGENRFLTNFPKDHYDNGVAKNSRTNDWYKPTVRIFKNANRYLVDNNLLVDGKAPSYFIECLVYSVPDEQFGDTFQKTFCNVVNWAQTNLSTIRRVSEQGSIIGSETGLWPLADARAYLDALIKLWNDWS